MTRKDFSELLAERVVTGDGAMGTMIYGKGVFVNTCFDELNLTRPELIREIHSEYAETGCDLLETNTFGANAFKLARFGLADKMEQINETAVKLAADAAGTAKNEIYIAGAIGPTGTEIIPVLRQNPERIRHAFAEQAQALCRAGADLIILETFANPDELKLAVEAVSDVCGLPIVAHLTTVEYETTIHGMNIATAAAEIAKNRAVTAVGLNCSQGPMEMLESLKLMRAAVEKPISVMPNAGLPRDVDGRRIYMCTPEYIAEYAKRFFENGASIIGGCCGTEPRHTREIVKAVRPLHKAAAAATLKPQMNIQVHEGGAKGSEPVPLEKRSKLGGKIARGESVTMIEITPPRGTDLSRVIEKVKLCGEHGIDAINIPDGPRASSRLSPMVTAVRISQATDALEPILHVCCRDRNIIGMQSDMLGAQALNLPNVLLVTGDPPKLGEFPEATAVFDLDSVALTKVVSNLNRGLDIAGTEFHPPLALTIGVGANPVASDLKREIDRFFAKAEAGAEYAVTQPVFDPEMLFTFADQVKQTKVPLVAGIWPFTSYKNAEFMANEVPGVVVPGELLERMKTAETKEQGRRLGIEIAREMIEQIKSCVAGFAVSAPFGNVRIALSVLGKIDIADL